jgi:transposase
MDLLTELTRANHDPAVIAQVRALMEQSAKAQQLLAEKDFKITALTLELAYYRRIKFGKKSEALSGEQRELFEETVNTDLAAIEAELVPPDGGDRAPRGQAQAQPGRAPGAAGRAATCRAPP